MVLLEGDSLQHSQNLQTNDLQFQKGILKEILLLPLEVQELVQEGF